ncbi:MAG TPA: hypothetical protein ENJ50_08110, partial [Planctomycetaceae bacterium]|nr:hypothetical protein [Planctomycetaceae bacterium]
DWRRLQRPYGGVVVTAMNEAGINRRGPLAGAGEWTHLYADASNTVCSNDELVEGPLQLQWFGRPGPQQMVDRHHRTVAPLCKEGRLFIPGDNRVIAVDAYNGASLWNVEVPNMRRVGVYRDCGSMAAASDMLYVASGSRCIGLDVETGRQQQEFFAADPDADQARDWGYVAVDGDWLFGSATRPGGSRRGHSLDAIRDGLYWDAHPLVCSLELFLIQRKTGRRVWTYRPSAGAMVNSTFTLGDGKIYFIESDNLATLDEPTGRSTLQDLLKQGCRLVALDCRDGSIAWSRSLALGNVQHVLYVAYARGRVVVVGSYNSGNDTDRDSVMYDIHVVDAQNGRVMWSKTQRQDAKIGGSHGEQDHHPVIVGNLLYCEPMAYDLETGSPVTNWKWKRGHRRGCGQVSASRRSLFFRHSHPTLFDLTTQTYEKITTTTRPGCWINSIPAGGLLLIPEASSGCTCDYAIQTSLAFRPVRDGSRKRTHRAGSK